MFDDLETIYKVFKELNFVEKVKYLKELEEKNLGYDINFENLINFWDGFNYEVDYWDGEKYVMKRRSV